MGQPDGAQSGADPNAQSGGAGPGTGDGGNGAQGGAGDASGAGQSSGGTGDGQPSGQTFTQAEMDAIRARMRAADQRSSELEKQLREIQTKDLPEVDKLKQDLTEATKRADEAEAALQVARVENAFLTDNTFDWQNPATALKLLDRSKITVDADGTVQGMKEALKALSTSDAYLLKPKPQNDGEGDGSGTPPIGTPPANLGNNSGSGQALSKAAMQKRFPAMRSRAGQD